MHAHACVGGAACVWEVVELEREANDMGRAVCVVVRGIRRAPPLSRVHACTGV
jgi:hypothetical protein